MHSTKWGWVQCMYKVCTVMNIRTCPWVYIWEQWEDVHVWKFWLNWRDVVEKMWSRTHWTYVWGKVTTPTEHTWRESDRSDWTKNKKEKKCWDEQVEIIEHWRESESPYQHKWGERRYEMKIIIQEENYDCTKQPCLYQVKKQNKKPRTRESLSTQLSRKKQDRLSIIIFFPYS